MSYPIPTSDKIDQSSMDNYELTYSDETEVEAALIRQIAQDVHEMRAENTSEHCTIITQNEKILELQKQLNQKTLEISELISIRQNTKRIYYLGTGAGIISIFGGFFYNIIPVSIAGIGITLTGLTGIWEARKYGY